MSRINVIISQYLEENKSLSISFETKEIDVTYLDAVAIGIKTAGITDNTGQFSIEGSIMKDFWQTITVTPSIPALANVDTQILINMQDVAFSKLRVKFVAAGGTPDGTCDISINGKSL